MNDTTNVTSYCLKQYNEVKGLKHCNTIYIENDGYYERGNTGNRFIKAFQLFKILINNVGDVFGPMSLTEEVMRTQFYDKVDEYKTLEYTEYSYRQEEYQERNNTLYKMFFDFETITSEKQPMPYLCWIYNEDI